MRQQSIEDSGGPVASRRAVLAGAGAIAAVTIVGGCATYDAGGGAPPPPPLPPAQPGADGVAAPPAALAQTGDIPVGSAVIVADRQVVVSQPAAGQFKAFTAICTHQGCLVSDVQGQTIVCNCHGSKFNATDGSVAGGPAGRPLKEVGIVVEGTDIRLA
jgi:nitrite reductase/ring-hydroxylating ferredoxin subunit